MKKLLLSLLLLTLAFSVSFAQEKKGERPDRGGRFELPKELNLTSEQQQKVNVINADFKAKFDALRADTAQSREKRRESTKALLGEYNKAVNQVLTPEQQTKFKEWKEKIKKENEAKRGEQNKTKEG